MMYNIWLVKIDSNFLIDELDDFNIKLIIIFFINIYVCIIM